MRFYRIDEDKRKNTKHQRNFPEIWGKMCDSQSVCVGLDRPVMTTKAHTRPAINLWSCEIIKKTIIFFYIHPVVFGSYIVYFFFFCRDKQDGYCQPRNFLSPECPKLSAWTEKCQHELKNVLFSENFSSIWTCFFAITEIRNI